MQFLMSRETDEFLAGDIWTQALYHIEPIFCWRGWGTRFAPPEADGRDRPVLADQRRQVPPSSRARTRD